ncbi:hypothetical protein EES39_33510 [Streptomyces sp. ADI92-24]|nr:hypothetical protein EES39_33510 [Streptomyces sp. ADI92-24]
MRLDPALPVGRAFGLADAVLDAELADRPLTDDVTTAAGLLDRFAELWLELGSGSGKAPGGRGAVRRTS